MLQIERNVAGTCILSTYNEWNCLHSYKIKSYKLIGLDKKIKIGVYKNYSSVTLHHIKGKIVHMSLEPFIYTLDIGDSL